MQLSHERSYRALVARDRRFDGLFFVGVTTTGVYCRPICPARTPGSSRCTFHASAALAEAAGFRACFRCRPELAPGSASVDRVSRLAFDASARIERGALDGEGSLESLAAELGVSSRHLRRVLEKELGVGPMDLAASHRLATAKRLLTDSYLSMSEIAFASGFSSIRRFNDAFRKRFGGPPRRLGRNHHADPAANSTLTLRLSFRPPLAWEALLGYLAPRAIPGLEAVDLAASTWRRLVVADGVASVIAVRCDAERSMLLAQIPASLSRHVRTLVPRLRALFDLDADPTAIRATLGASLGHLLKRTPGLRVPGAFDGFELAVRAILGQQVSVVGATTLAARLVERFGEVHDTGEVLSRAFPSAARLAASHPNELAAIGVPLARAAAIHHLASQVAMGAIALDDPTPHPQSIEGSIARLVAQPGIGPWTASYIAMRALRWPDAFLAGDLGVRKALGTGGVPISEGEAAICGEQFRPYRAYAVLHLWHSLSSASTSTATPRRTR
jgi:AraC family transcriptional regulator of adaptative response / DNA-3-methyladenine glycosylase II